MFNFWRWQAKIAFYMLKNQVSENCREEGHIKRVNVPLFGGD